MLVFVIPVQHPSSAGNWPLVRSLLPRTIRSACAQREGPFRTVVVVNRGVAMPELPRGAEIAWVDFEPPDPPPRRELFPDEESWRDVIRFDKGRRVLAGILHARDTLDVTHVMTVDADDFVSNRLAGHVARHAGANGWYVRTGYVWSGGGSWLYRYPEFFLYCGTSHLVRIDLLRLPDRVETADPEYVRWMIGSHKALARRLVESGTPLDPLPFPGAIYRIGHAGSATNSKGLRRTFFPRWQLRADPVEYVRRLGRLRRLTPEIRAEFGLESGPGAS